MSNIAPTELPGAAARGASGLIHHKGRGRAPSAAGAAARTRARRTRVRAAPPHRCSAHLLSLPTSATRIPLSPSNSNPKIRTRSKTRKPVAVTTPRKLLHADCPISNIESTSGCRCSGRSVAWGLVLLITLLCGPEGIAAPPLRRLALGADVLRRI